MKNNIYLQSQFLKMFTFLKDIFLFAFDKSEKNRFWQLLTFCLKDYPAYFRVQPTFKKIPLFFVLATRIILYGYDKNWESKIQNSK